MCLVERHVVKVLIRLRAKFDLDPIIDVFGYISSDARTCILLLHLYWIARAYKPKSPTDILRDLIRGICDKTDLRKEVARPSRPYWNSSRVRPSFVRLFYESIGAHEASRARFANEKEKETRGTKER